MVSSLKNEKEYKKSFLTKKENEAAKETIIRHILKILDQKQGCYKLVEQVIFGAIIIWNMK